jgi:hypothetical protein
MQGFVSMQRNGTADDLNVHWSWRHGKYWESASSVDPVGQDRKLITDKLASR